MTVVGGFAIDLARPLDPRVAEPVRNALTSLNRIALYPNPPHTRKVAGVDPSRDHHVKRSSEDGFEAIDQPSGPRRAFYRAKFQNRSTAR